jgi:PilZ domain-containing protein
MSLASLVGDLRRFLRSRARDEVYTRIEGFDRMTVVLRDVAPGGFAIIAPMPFAPGERYRFFFTLPNGSVLGLLAIAVHRYPLKHEGDARRFVIGWRFLPENADEDIEKFVNAAASSKPASEPHRQDSQPND